VGLDKRARDDESAHLVHRVERLACIRVPRNVEVVGVRGDIVQDVLRPTLVAQHPDAAHGMQLSGRARLVVPVVDEAEHSPALFVLAETAGVGAHGGLDAAHVAAQLLRLGHRGDELPCFVARRWASSAIAATAPATANRSSLEEAWPASSDSISAGAPQGKRTRSPASAYDLEKVRRIRRFSCDLSRSRQDSGAKST